MMKKVNALIEEVEKELGNDGRVLVRKSGTEPLIRVMVEAESAEKCEELACKIAEELEKFSE